MDQGGDRRSIPLVYKAIELDADFAAAYAAAARNFCRRKAFAWHIDREKEIAEARRLARRAAQLGKDDAAVLADAGYALAYVVGDLDDGAAFIVRALLINPNLASAWSSSGHVKLWLGEPDQAVERFEHAMRLSPMDPTLVSMQHGRAHAHFFTRRCDDDALKWAEMALRERPDGYVASRIAAASSVLAGRGEEAKRPIARLLEIDPALRISNFENVVGPWRPEYLAKYKDALRKAGLPEL